MDEPIGNARVGVDWAAGAIAKMRAQIVRELGLAGDQAGGAFSARLAGFGAQAQQTGKQLTTQLTLPIVGFGAASIAAFTSLEEGMANVATLIPGNEARIAELTGTVQDLSVATAKSTDDLTDGLYQTVSAFGDSADSAAILEINAKAAAAGLATTTDAIGLTSAVTKAYGDTSAEAVEQVADLSLLTVRLGQTTFPELASSMGRVTPLAAGLGVSMEELYGTMATFTGVTGTAAEVSTQLRGMLQALMAPTASMEDLFADLGVASGEALIEQMGLVGATQAIVAAAEESGAPLQDFIGSIEGQTFALAGAGAQADVWVDKTAQMSDATGTLGEAFDEVASTDAFAMRQAMQEVTTELQAVGADLAPLAADIASFGADAVGVFTDLPTPIQNTAIAVGGIAAAAGPTMFVIGGVAQGISAVSSVAQGAAAGIQFFTGRLAASAEAGSRLAGVTQSALVPGIGIATAALAVGGAAYAIYANKQAEADRVKREFIATLDEETGALTANTEEQIKATLQDRNQLDDLERAGVTWEQLTAAIQDNSAASLDWSGWLDTAGTSMEHLGAGLESYIDEIRSVEDPMARLIVQLYDAGELNEGLVDSLHQMSGAMAEGRTESEALAAVGAPVLDLFDAFKSDAEDLTVDLGELSGAAGAVSFDPLTGELREARTEAQATRDELDGIQSMLLGAVDAELGLQSAQMSEDDAAARVAEAQQNLIDIANEHGWASKEAADAQRELDRANLSLEQAQIGTAKAALRVEESLREQAKSTEEAGGAFGEMGVELDRLAEKYPTAEEGLGRIITLLDELDGTRTVLLQWEFGPPPAGWEEQGNSIDDWQAFVEGLAGSGMAGSPAPVDPPGRAHGGPTAAGRIYEVNEQGPEVWTSGGRTWMLADQAGTVTPYKAGGVNITHRYDGIPADQAVDLAQRRTTRDLALLMAGG